MASTKAAVEGLYEDVRAGEYHRFDPRTFLPDRTRISQSTAPVYDAIVTQGSLTPAEIRDRVTASKSAIYRVLNNLADTDLIYPRSDSTYAAIRPTLTGSDDPTEKSMSGTMELLSGLTALEYRALNQFDPGERQDNETIADHLEKTPENIAKITARLADRELLNREQKRKTNGLYRYQATDTAVNLVHGLLDNRYQPNDVVPSNIADYGDTFLAYVFLEDEVTSTEIMDRFDLKRQTVHTRFDRLMDYGYLEREPIAASELSCNTFYELSLSPLGTALLLDIDRVNRPLPPGGPKEGVIDDVLEMDARNYSYLRDYLGSAVHPERAQVLRTALRESPSGYSYGQGWVITASTLGGSTLANILYGEQERLGIDLGLPDSETKERRAQFHQDLGRVLGVLGNTEHGIGLFPKVSGNSRKMNIEGFTPALEYSLIDGIDQRYVRDTYSTYAVAQTG